MLRYASNDSKSAWTVPECEPRQHIFQARIGQRADSTPKHILGLLFFALTALLETYGPALGRPHADTLSGSKHANMKELRFRAGGGVWRVAFAFDPARRAIVLVAGEKAGVAQDRFYKALIRKADNRFTAHLERLKEA
jgi:hypothetical protein